MDRLLTRSGGLKIEENTGGDAGYIADITRFPDQHLSVATLCNLGGIDPVDLAIKIGDICLDGKVSAVIEADRPHPSADAQITPEQGAKYVGTYIGPEANLVLKIVQRPRGLWRVGLWGRGGPSGPLGALGSKRSARPGQCPLPRVDRSSPPSHAPGPDRGEDSSLVANRGQLAG
jgi:hypothetical protein